MQLTCLTNRVQHCHETEFTHHVLENKATHAAFEAAQLKCIDSMLSITTEIHFDLFVKKITVKIKTVFTVMLQQHNLR